LQVTTTSHAMQACCTAITTSQSNWRAWQ
jgi:hypothetical protein